MQETKLPLEADSAATFVEFRSVESGRCRAPIAHLGRQKVVFELRLATELVRTSEALKDFRVVLRGRESYAGNATVQEILHTGQVFLCCARLDGGWADVQFVSPVGQVPAWQGELTAFLRNWQKACKIDAGFKVLLADIQSFLTELKLWTEQLELGLQTLPEQERAPCERDLLTGLRGLVTSTLNGLFERFELFAGRIEQDLESVHHTYIKHQIHPWVMCSPFGDRTFRKPLGYAGDYEMVNMILRDPFEGESLYAKLINAWFLDQPPAQAHRNRIEYLTQKLVEETARVAAAGRCLRVLSLGCGPAQEVQNFLARSGLSDHVHFQLLDFNDETLGFTRSRLEKLRTTHGRSTRIDLVKRSVVQVLKAGARAPTEQFDYIYCAGLFDYLPDHVCKQLNNSFYQMLAPGGLLLVTNVDASNPIRCMLDYVLEWHLIYRTGEELRALRPDAVALEDAACVADSTSVNVFVGVRKPAR